MARNTTRNINLVYRKPRASIVESIFGTPRERIQKAQLEADKGARILQQEQRKIETTKRNYTNQVISTINAMKNAPYFQLQDMLDTLSVEYRKVLDDETIDNTLKLAHPILGPRNQNYYNASKGNYDIYKKLQNSTHSVMSNNEIQTAAELKSLVYGVNPDGDLKELIDSQVKLVSLNLIQNDPNLNDMFTKASRETDRAKTFLAESLGEEERLLTLMGKGKRVSPETNKANFQTWTMLDEGDKKKIMTQLEEARKSVNKYGAEVDSWERYEENPWNFINDNIEIKDEWLDTHIPNSNDDDLSLNNVLDNLNKIETREDLNKVIELASDMQPTPPVLAQPESIPSDVQIGVESTLALSEKAPNLFTNQKGEEIPLDDDTDYDEPSDILNITNMISSMYG